MAANFVDAQVPPAPAMVAQDHSASYLLQPRALGAQTYLLSPVERAQRVKQGVPARELVTVSQAMGLPREQLMRALGLARSTVERKIAQRGTLSQPEGERLIGLERLIGRSMPWCATARPMMRRISTRRAGSRAGWSSRSRRWAAWRRRTCSTRPTAARR
jgi:hypothetical protein